MSIIKEITSDSNFIRKLTGLALPIAFQSFMLASVAASDTVMLGSLAQNAMSAVSLASQVQFVQNLTVMGIIAAFQVLGAQYAGRGDRDKLNRLFCMALRICIIVSAVFAYLCYFRPSFLMHIFTDEESLAEIGIGYLRIAAVSYLITGISQPLIALIKLGRKTSVVAYISGVAVVLNIALNAILIFGLLGIPSMGVAGAALATVISRAVELVLAAAFSIRDETIRPRLSALFSFSRTLSADFIRQLIPLLGAYVIWTLGYSSYSAFLGHMGVDAAAANSVASVLRNLVGCFMKGPAGGSSILIGNELGQGNLSRAKLYGDRLMIISLICGVFSSILIQLSVPIALHVMKLSPEAERNLIAMSAVLSLYMIGASFNSVVINGMFASGGDTLFDCYSIIVTMGFIAVPLAAAGTFAFGWPVAVVYGCTCLDEVGKIPWTIYHYKKYRWLKDLTRK